MEARNEHHRCELPKLRFQSGLGGSGGEWSEVPKRPHRNTLGVEACKAGTYASAAGATSVRLPTMR